MSWRPARARKFQFRVKKILVSDQNFKIVREPGVIAQARKIGSILQRPHLCFLLAAYLLQLFDVHQRVRYFTEAVLRRLLVLSQRLVKARLVPS